MITTRNLMVALAAGGSIAILLGAFGFQYIGGVAPCPMCLWQRWPHAVAFAIGVIAVVLPWRVIAWLGATTMAVSAGLGLYHSGVERKFWDGPQSCTGGGPLDSTSLLDFSAAPTLVMCDEIAWDMFGLTMANYNALASVMFCALWVMVARGVSDR